MTRLAIAAAALLALAATGAAAQSGSSAAITDGPLGLDGGERTGQPLAAAPPVRPPLLRDVEPRAALGEDRFAHRLDDPPQGDRDNPMPPGGDRPLRIETDHTRTGMRPAQAPALTPAR